MDYLSESLKLHYELRGKLEIQPRAGVSNKDELSLAYTPGVAAACLEIKDDVSKSYDLTRPGTPLPSSRTAPRCLVSGI